MRTSIRKAQSSSPARASAKAASFFVKPKGVRMLGPRTRSDGDNPCFLLLPNGARIIGLPENEDTLRGFDNVVLMLIDEASRVSDGMYRALRPMLAVGRGALWLLSTPNGRSGFFYEAWISGRDWTRIEASAKSAPAFPRSSWNKNVKHSAKKSSARSTAAISYAAKARSSMKRTIAPSSPTGLRPCGSHEGNSQATKNVFATIAIAARRIAR